MIVAATFLSASGAGESFCRLAMAFSAMPLLGPSLAARSNSTVSTPALLRCAAICAPMTPAPSTAALRIRSALGMDGAVIGFSVVRNAGGDGTLSGETDGRGRPKESGGSGGVETRGGEADQVLRGLLAVAVLGHVALALDHAEARHGM